MKKTGGKCFMARVTSNPASINFENEWILDSGCSHHVTGDASKFSSLHPYQGKDAIVIAGKTVHYVEKEGTVVINGSKDNSITLNNVYRVPADVVHIGKRVNDVYVLSTSTSFVEKLSGHDTASIWHARLGHLNMTKFKVMVQKELVKGLQKITKFTDGESYEGCQYGKAHRLPFDKSLSKCKAPLDYIHTDLF
ncbi:hypothetical protein L6164_002042 [Bauhinia variegata]|uniref:Uncharacterized protein n=1 Tax=Bauhinia variegata TaxID=167791 RepID=A0ACB9PWG2_BAUVA|nr:hypothetical protein L6164_002042 [Bauhinia variegata]